MLKRLAVALTAAMALATTADAQSWPANPIPVIVPFGAASGTDIVAPIELESVAAKLGQSMVIETRPGAGVSIKVSGAAAPPSCRVRRLFERARL